MRATISSVLKPPSLVSQVSISKEGAFNPRERLGDVLEEVDEQKLDVSISDREKGRTAFFFPALAIFLFL